MHLSETSCPCAKASVSEACVHPMYPYFHSFPHVAQTAGYCDFPKGLESFEVKPPLSFVFSEFSLFYLFYLPSYFLFFLFIIYSLYHLNTALLSAQFFPHTSVPSPCPSERKSRHLWASITPSICPYSRKSSCSRTKDIFS